MTQIVSTHRSENIVGSDVVFWVLSMQMEGWWFFVNFMGLELKSQIRLLTEYCISNQISDKYNPLLVRSKK